MEMSEGQMDFQLCSVKLIRENLQVKVFPVFDERYVEFFALEQKMTKFPEDFITDLDQILLHFTGLLVKVKKIEIEKIEPLCHLFTEKLQEIVFDCGINNENLVANLKSKFIEMHSLYDKEHSSVLIELRNSLIEKCRMPKEIKKFFIKRKTLDEANSRFQERVLMMKTHKIKEIQTIFENVYEGFIVDSSYLSQEFLSYEQIMKEKKISVFNCWKNDIKDYLKNIIMQRRYSWIVIRENLVKSNIRKIPKNYQINFGTIDALLSSNGIFEITQCLSVEDGVCLTVSLKPENPQANPQQLTTEKSLILFYVRKKREAIHYFSEGPVKIASGSEKNQLIVLHQFRKILKLIQRKGKFIETEKIELQIETYLVVNEIAYIKSTDKIVFTTNDNVLFIISDGVLMKVSDSVIHCLRFDSRFNSLVVVYQEEVKIFDGDVKELVKFGLENVSELGIFNEQKTDLSCFGISFTGNKIFICNLRENSIIYYKINCESNMFTAQNRKTIYQTMIEDAGNLSPTIKDWFRNTQGFDKVDIRSALDIYLVSLAKMKSSIEEERPKE
jgi:hypothetical protein